MKRTIALGVVILAGMVAPPAVSQQDQAKTLQVTKIRDNFYVLKGGGGNTCVFIMSDGVTVIDTKFPGWGHAILAEIKKLTDKPVVRVINTHTHSDHVGGNVDFPAGVDIVAQENTRANMQEWRTPSDSAKSPENVFKEHAGFGMPTRTFETRLSIGKGPDEIELYYFGRGHTDGDAWVYIPALRVMCAGDMFSGKNLPRIDVNNGGNGVSFPETLQKAYDTVKDVDVIITGHSKAEMTRDDLKQYIDFNREFINDMRQNKEAGKSVDEAVSSWKMPAQYVGYTFTPADNSEDRLRINAHKIYDELK